ncbi:hypothetical protein TSUD_340850 [Trifolium subterraneum]|uniref:Transmembrane protein n=1 Tax=Trifolium subterraneum TaxID=3900 RepID=A0A2Z6LYY4_TRISU|nr:hypothetical protein TSUD_340850 [Trifolium subterraneum]
MESSMRLGLMAVFAVSGSMVLLAHQVHKRILSNFMKKFEFEISGIIYPKKFNGHEKHHHHLKKKVRFAKHEMELPMENKSYINREDVIMAQRVRAEQIWVMENVQKCGPKLEDTMPPNRAVLYRGLMKYRTPGRFRF